MVEAVLVEAFVGEEEEDTLPRTAVILDVLAEVDDELILLLVLDDFAAVDEVDGLIAADELADFTTADEPVFAVDDEVDE